jgi:predicted membrane channel-forming protein YqfA (hemolysin III family)
MLYPGLFGLALLCAVGGGALSRNWTDAWRAVLNGAVIASGYMSVYFVDALIEDHAARTLQTVGWMALSGVVLVVALKGLQRLPPPPLDTDAFH